MRSSNVAAGRFVVHLVHSMSRAIRVTASCKQRGARRILELELDAQRFQSTLSAGADLAFGLLDESLELAQLAQCMNFRWNVSCVLQDSIRHSQLLGNHWIFVEIERLAGARQVVECAFAGGFGDSPVSECFEDLECHFENCGFT